MSSSQHPSIAFNAFAVDDDPRLLIFAFELRSQGKLSANLVVDLCLTLASPVRPDQITYQSNTVRIHSDRLDLRAGKNAFKEKIELDKLKPPLASAITKITEGRQTAYPQLQLSINLSNGSGTVTEAKTSVAAPEQWFWSINRRS
jgi:hypothetical protein